MVGDQSWSLTAKPCDSCKAAPATAFCRADSAFLCVACDAKIHAANKLASRHARVWVCEVCEQAPAAVTCKADAAALCPACDRDIHSANPLARRHARLPLAPFYDSAAKEACCSEEEEAEAASWLLPDDPNGKEPGSPEYKTEYLFGEMDDPYNLDLGLMMAGDQQQQKKGVHVGGEEEKQQQYSSDGVVPVGVVDGFPTTYDVEGPKPFMYNFTSQSISQSVSSSSLDVGVVPDHSALADVSKIEAIPIRLFGIDREARVLRYKEKRKNRKFEKTIRYASRKAYAETRPRIKGRFAKRLELEAGSLLSPDASYGVVPTF